MIALIVDTYEGNRAVVIFASTEAMERWREVAEEKGVETYGILDVVSRTDALLGERGHR